MACGHMAMAMARAALAMVVAVAAVWLWPLWLWLWPTYGIPTRQAACQFVGLVPTSPYISPISPLYLPYISPDISQARGVPVRRPHACPPAEWTAAAGAW